MLGFRATRASLFHKMLIILMTEAPSLKPKPHACRLVGCLSVAEEPSEIWVGVWSQECRAGSRFRFRVGS